MQDESGKILRHGAVICGKVLAKAERTLAEQAASHYRWPLTPPPRIERFQPTAADLAMAERALFEKR